MLSCTNSKTEKDIQNEPSKEMTLEELVVRHVEADLEIPHDEKFTYEIHKEYLNDDSLIDAIITVNRLDFALEEARLSGNAAKKAEIGFSGRYNYVFYYDGISKKITPSISIASSPHAKLKVRFQPIINEFKNDVIIDYVIRNARFRNYYTIINNAPKLIFQWNVYDFLGEEKEVANFITYDKGSYSDAQDILIFDGKITNNKSIEDIYNFEPKIESNEKLIHRFFYLEKEGKYFTNK